MRTLMIPKEGEPFFGEDIPAERVGQRLARLADPFGTITSARRPVAEPTYEPVLINYYDFKGTIVRRQGQPVIAIYEQI